MKVARVSYRRQLWVLGAILFASYAYFYQAGGWNQNSRFALVRAILERHTLEIDAYHLHTGDRAIWKGHYYSDKPPGTSLMVLAPVGLARSIARAVGVDPESFPGIAWTSYVAAVVSSGVFTVIAALSVLMIGVRWGFSPGAALFAATAYGLAGPAWAYATLFMGHGVVAGCLMVAYWSAFELDSSDERRRRDLGTMIGFSAGWAVVTESQAVIPAAVIVATAFARTYRWRRPDFQNLVVRVLVAGALCAAVLLGYNALAFGNPLHIGYASEEGFEQLHTGLFGITRPQWWRVRELLVGSYRGLLPLSPLVAIMPIGLVALAIDARRRTAALVAAFIGMYYLLLNASYFYWEGGWAYGPRQMTPALPFLALGLLPLWDARRRVLRIALAAGWLWGVAITVVAVSTNPQPPSSFKAPVRELLWPAFVDGDLSLNHQTFVHGGASPSQMRGHQIPHAAWNLGEIAGLQGHASLLPLGAVWIAGGLLLFL
jgi:hypothetical protein